MNVLRYLGAGWSKQAFLGEVSLAQNYGGRRYGGPPTPTVSTLPPSTLTEEQLVDWEATHGEAPPGSHPLRPHPDYPPPTPATPDSPPEDVSSWVDPSLLDPPGELSPAPEFTPPAVPQMTTDSRAAFEEPVPVVNEMPVGEPVATPSAAPSASPLPTRSMTDPSSVTPPVPTDAELVENLPPVASASAAEGIAADALGELANRYTEDETKYADVRAEIANAKEAVLSDIPENRRGAVETAAKEAYPAYRDLDYAASVRTEIEGFSPVASDESVAPGPVDVSKLEPVASGPPGEGGTRGDRNIPPEPLPEVNKQASPPPIAKMTPTEGGSWNQQAVDINPRAREMYEQITASGGGGQPPMPGGIPGMDLTASGGGAGAVTPGGGGGMPGGGGGMPDVGDTFDPMEGMVASGMPGPGAGGLYGVRRISKESFFWGGR